MSGPRLQTRAVRAGIDCDASFGAVTPPLVLSSNFSFDGLGGNGRRRARFVAPFRGTAADVVPVFPVPPLGVAMRHGASAGFAAEKT